MTTGSVYIGAPYVDPRKEHEDADRHLGTAVVTGGPARVGARTITRDDAASVVSGSRRGREIPSAAVIDRPNDLIRSMSAALETLPKKKHPRKTDVDHRCACPLVT